MDAGCTYIRSLRGPTIHRDDDPALELYEEVDGSVTDSDYCCIHICSPESLALWFPS